VNGARGAALSSARLASKTHGVRRGRDLGNQLADPSNRDAVSGQIGRTVLLEQQVPQAVVVSLEAAVLGPLRGLERNAVR
jgi:hypothetical protein